MATKTIIEIGMKGYIELPVDDLDRQIEILQTLKTAHTSGDYGALLSLATVEEVKAEQKRRRFDEQASLDLPPEVAKLFAEANEIMSEIDYVEDIPYADPVDAHSDTEGVPEFLTKPKPRTGRNG